MSEPRRQLFSDAERTRFFLVPEGVTLPEGRFVITDLTGRTQRRVDEAALAPHEVERARAHAHLRAVASGALESVGAELGAFVRQWKQGREAPPWSEAAQRQVREAAAARPGLALLADLVGEDAETLRADSSALVGALEALGRDLGALVERSVRGDGDALEAARAKARELQAKLQAHGIPVKDGLDAWPDRLRRFVEADGDVDLARAGADALDRAAAAIEGLLGKAAERVRDAADAVERGSPHDTSK